MIILLYVNIVKAFKVYAFTLVWLYAMVKPGYRRITIEVREELWKRFLVQVIKEHGVVKQAGTEIEQAIKEYLDKREKS
jgi:hypothetical protein